MALVRIMAVFQGASLAPEDRFVNTFHFADLISSYESVLEDLHSAVQDFYSSTSSGGNTLGNHISAYVNRSYVTQAYNLADPPPRSPDVSGNSLAPALETGLPEEVAVCLTLRGEPPVTPRRRGRLYIGPLSRHAGVLEGGTTVTHAHPANSSAGMLVQNMIASAGALVAASSLAGCPWSIRSTRPSENFVPIVGGWVDNSFDTQRRRGPDSDDRDEWGS